LSGELRGEQEVFESENFGKKIFVGFHVFCSSAFRRGASE
jgi:hypothetical protein